VIRIFDIFFSFVGLIILFPFFLIITLIIKFTTKGPVFYKQKRVGILNRDIIVWKFRTMIVSADNSGLLTIGAKDSRITRIGFLLRKYKIDELPQLFNVFFGSMSLVGPRPEVRKYVNYYTIEQSAVLNIKPGITDWASIEFVNENIILSSSQDPEYLYIRDIIPRKIELSMRYIQNRSLKEYFKIIFLTIYKIFKT
jgi:lipopolysaccharide/colanic/teichoic acid biosynthesis glycosyltransferase